MEYMLWIAQDNNLNGCLKKFNLNVNKYPGEVFIMRSSEIKYPVALYIGSDSPQAL